MIFGWSPISCRTSYERSLTTKLNSNTNHKVLEAVYPKLLIKAKGQQSVLRIKSNKQNKVGFWTWHCILSPQTSWLVNTALNELQMRGCGNPSDLSPTQHQIPLLSRNTHLQLVCSRQLTCRWLGRITAGQRCKELVLLQGPFSWLFYLQHELKLALESRDNKIKGISNFQNHTAVIGVFKQMHRHYF